MGHGWHCQCPRCRVARPQWGRQRRVRQKQGLPAPCTLVDVTGTRRRAQALCCLGYGLRHQARLVGMQEESFRRVLYVPRVRQSTVDKVKALYERLWDKPAPPAPWSNRVRNWAARNGWAPPLAWDDDTIDSPTGRPAVGGWDGRLVDELAVSIVVDERMPIRLAGADRREAVRRLKEAGMEKDRIYQLVSGRRR